MKKNTHFHSGFTLVELLVSIGVFIIVFISMTQIFFLMQGTIARINAQREMVAWLSTITQTISTDLENFAINAETSDARTLSLESRSKDEKVFYRVNPAPASLHTNSGSSASGWSISREVSTGSGTSATSSIAEFTSPLFYLEDVHLRVTPEKGDQMRCSVLPAAMINLTLAPRPESKRLGTQKSYLQTTFSSNDNPLSYSKACQ